MGREPPDGGILSWAMVFSGHEDGGSGSLRVSNTRAAPTFPAPSPELPGAAADCLHLRRNCADCRTRPTQAATVPPALP
ncbi:hypothetical protein GCM10007904_35270 [Oharaeibacter diazotrophicus]|nr:hypothetical protein GCM10007904_35270 [Oharaeibacter diazotrophicus]